MKVPDRRRRLRSSQGFTVVAARRAGVGQHWQHVTGHIDFVESSSLIVGVARTRIG